MGITFHDKHGQSVTMTFEEHEAYMKPARLHWEDRSDPIWAQRISPDFKFAVGKKYPTLGGKIVTIIAENGECVQGDDCGPDGLSGFRYNRMSDIGRATGSTWDADNNLIPFEVKG